MILSAIIIIGCFIGVVLLILTDKLNRAIAALGGAVIVYFVLLFMENFNFSIIVDLLFGTAEDEYVNLHSLILIVAMMIIVSVCNDAGVFQFIAINLIKLSKGNPIKLLVINCCLTVFVSALLNNILTVIVLIPLTITISRMLTIDPKPYILTQAILVNIGGTMFSISSIPNILISTYAQISFVEFFLNVGIYSLIILACTIPFFMFLYKKELNVPVEGAEVLMDFNIWNVVQNKRLLLESMIGLFSVIVLFVLIPASLVTPDIIALTIAVILVILSTLEPKEIIARVDMELLLYLLGIFIIAGALEIIGFTDLLGIFLLQMGGTDAFTQVLVILWFSAILSSNIDNIPITKVLIPVIDVIPAEEMGVSKNQFFYSLAIGANWGDNLTPLGDNILVMNIAEQNKRPITFKEFFKLGFTTTVYQLAVMSLVFTLIFVLVLGIIIIIIIASVLIGISLFLRYGPTSKSRKLKSAIDKIRNKIIK